MASQRLRRAFRSLTDEDVSPEEMNEEEQERLIVDLEEHDKSRTQFYRTAFLANPLLAAAFYVVDFVTAKTPLQRLISFISFTSLLATAFIIHYLPLGAVDTKGKKPVYLSEAAKSPLERYLPLINGLPVSILLLGTVFSFLAGNTPKALREAAPAVIYGLSMFIREQLRPLNMNELQQARYELKGA